jgi:transcriptional regulator of arginine metabolism
MRPDRRRDLMRILHGGEASSQRSIVEALQAAGHDVTQATVSRDLRAVGAAKVRINGHYAYMLADDLPRSAGGDLVARHLGDALAEFILDIRIAGSIVVLTTAPGHAGAVARAIDLGGDHDVVGTVAGDDTIFVATSDQRAAARVAAGWREELRLSETQEAE